MRVALILKALVSAAVLLWCLSGLTLGLYSYVYAVENADMPNRELVIDDRRQADLTSALGTRWRLVSDQVMGGVSQGTLTLETLQGRACLRLQGQVATDNNGGFIQIALDYAPGPAVNTADYTGLKLDVLGNEEQYSVHLRTRGLWLPWQAYRASFEAGPGWRTVTLPFDRFKAYKTSQAFEADKLKRIGLVAIGRDFDADICLADIRLYR